MAVAIAVAMALAVAVTVSAAAAAIVANVTAVAVSADSRSAARGAGDGPVVTDNHSHCARIAEIGTGAGTAAWTGGRRLASGRTRYGPANRVSRPPRWWRAGQMLDRRATHGNGQHHADEPSNRHAGKDQD
jgi:hypothetical protein